MKKLLLTLLLGVVTCAVYAQTAVFDWSAPGSLTPSYPAPTADSRYGEYISNVTFTANDVTLKIDDSSVKELSQRARFLYGYVTQTVEMRAYASSVITIEVSQDKAITSILFEGAKVGDDYLSYTGTDGAFSGTQWTAAPGTSVCKVDLDVLATINCTRTTVNFATAGVDDISVDGDDAASQWYTLSGMALQAEPQAPGLYIVRRGAKVAKVVKGGSLN